MLGKLMKYDLRAYFRRFGALWIALLALSLINGFSLHGLFEQAASRGSFARLFFSVLPPMALFGVYVATAVLMLVFVCERFYKGLLGDEGYLAFTLPAPVSAHIASKTLSALIVWVLSFLVACVSGFMILVLARPDGFSEALRQMLQILRQVGNERIPAAVPWLVLEGIVLSLIGVAAEILKIYTAIALGHLAKKHRVLWAILSYIGINLVQSFLLGISVDNGLVAALFRGIADTDWGVMYSADGWVIQGAGIAAGVMGGAILFELLLCALYFFVTRLLLTKKLNLE